MKAKKLQVKLFVDDAETVQPDPIVPVFHDWIKRGALSELMIDVVDYQHVFQGPSVLLVGHESDYAIDFRDGRPGLVYSRKRGGSDDPKALVVDALRRALRACSLLAKDRSLDKKPSFSGRQIEVRINDRRVARNDDATYAEVRPVVEAALKELYGDTAFTVERRNAEDPRQQLTLVVDAPGAGSVGELAARLD